MNRLLFLFCLFLGTVATAQDSLSARSNPVTVDKSKVIPVTFAKGFKQQYKGADFQYEVKVVQNSIWDRFKEWLSHVFESLFGVSDGVSGKAVNITLNIIATLIVLFVIYMIVKIVLNKEGNWVFGKSTTKKIIDYDAVEQNLHVVDFEKLIAATLQTGNLRLAIRYYYLWVLRKMSEKDIIDWNPEKTNSDYFYEIKNEALRQDFTYISYLYNYIWYGEFDITEDHFRHIRKTFENTLKSVS